MRLVVESVMIELNHALKCKHRFFLLGMNSSLMDLKKLIQDFGSV